MITNAMQSKFGYEWGQQFTPPRSFEFAGRTISLRFENLEAKAEFTDDTHVIWTADRGREETSYFCLKSTDRVYLIAFGFQGDRCITLIVDTETSLVTLHETSFDAEKRPYTSAVLFGILDDGTPGDGQKPLPAELHGYTKDLAGHAILWIFNDTYWHVESYTEDECTHNSNEPAVDGKGPYKAVKITDTLYYMINGDSFESICMIYNLRNLTCVGRSVVYDSSGGPLPQGAVGKYSDTAELPEKITIVTEGIPKR